MRGRQLVSALSECVPRRASSRPLPTCRWAIQRQQVRPSTSGPYRPTGNSSSGNGSSRTSNGATIAGAVGVGAVGFVAGVVFTKNGRSSDTEVHTGATAYANHTGMLHAAEEIAQALGRDAVCYDADVLEHHGHSAWSTSNSPGRAAAVVYPKSTEDVACIARICHRCNVPMVPFGAGSSVEGNFSQPHSGICIDFAYMDKIVAFHPDDLDVVVQPGVNWVNLNHHVAGSGLFAPMDPSPTATVGGMVSTNCSGTNAFRYGTMKDWVLNLTVVLADGTVIKTRRRPRKTSAGYNLTSLFVGAEGTLGIVTEATLKLAPIPQATSVAVVPFPTIHEAASAATALIRSGIQLAALEIMDEQQMAILNTHGSAAVRKRHWAEQPTLFLKFSGTPSSVQSDMSHTSALLHTLTSGTAPFTPARTDQEAADLWAARKESLFTMTSLLPPGFAMWSTDVAVPVSRLAELMDWSKRECGALGLFASVVGHVGDGNFHVAMMYDPRNEAQVRAVGACVRGMMDRALEMEGTVSGEHGIGIGKKECLREEVGEETVGVMRRLKRAVDPKGVMNPGKVFDL